MSRHMSISTSMARRSSAFQSFTMRKKSDVEIVLDDHRDFVSSYSTHDRIQGKVIAKFDKDTAFDDIQITFEGQTNTYVEKVASTAPTAGRATGRHIFLKLVQPIDPDLLPEDQIAKAGVTYTIPFTFVVPERLLPQICTHRKDHPGVLDAHLQLPPSLGDPMVAGDGQTFLDDMAPDMAKVSYNIKVKMRRLTSTGREVEIADKFLRLRIIPAFDEKPPVEIYENSKEYEIRKEKDVKKGLFKIGKIGRITAEAVQPKSFRLAPPRSKSQAPVSTMTTINLRFDPNDANDQPPPLGSVVSKLRVHTFFGAAPFKTLPTKASFNNWDVHMGYFVDSVELSSRCISTVNWVRHESDESPGSSSTTDLARRPSTLSIASTSSIPEPSASYTGQHFWTASVLVPLSLPKNKSFAPSFYTCIVARNYVLELNISYHAPGTTVSTPSILLRLPIQISAESNPDAAPAIEADEAAAIARREAHEYFEPRSIAPPSPEYTERSTYTSLGAPRHASVAEPPQYSHLHSQAFAAAPPEPDSVPGSRSQSVSVSTVC